MDAGVAGVVAMRYNVYVVTAARFIGEVYAGLLAGQPLGAAVSAARRQLAADPQREVGGEPLPLQDWMVPVVYEAAPLALLPPKAGDQQLSISLSQAEAGRERAGLERGLPAGPDAGFFGRDETLLALDRAFDDHRVVLLHAWAGAGKTSTVLEFARWYALVAFIARSGTVCGSDLGATMRAQMRSDTATVTANCPMTCPDACDQASRSRVRSVVVIVVGGSNRSRSWPGW
jgi:hypothetical protein